jgi:hypothetical protein
MLQNQGLHYSRYDAVCNHVVYGAAPLVSLMNHLGQLDEQSVCNGPTVQYKCALDTWHSAFVTSVTKNNYFACK